MIRHVHAGDIVVGGPEDELRAILGSCVAVTLWHPLRRIGVMSHIVLPAHRGGQRRKGAPAEDTRFADEAWRAMQKSLREHGISVTECQCKLFGGAQVFASGSEVGGDNVRALRDLLGQSGLTIVREHVEGTGHRVLRFMVGTGDVWVSHRQGTIQLPAKGFEQ